MSNDSTDSNSGGNHFSPGGMTTQASGAGQLGPTQLSHVQRVGSFRSRLKKQNPICMAEPPPIFVETPSKSGKPQCSAKPTMVVFGPSTSVDSASSLGLTPASRVAVSVQMCDDTALPGDALIFCLLIGAHAIRMFATEHSKRSASIKSSNFLLMWFCVLTFKGKRRQAKSR